MIRVYEKYYVFFGLIPRYRVVKDIKVINKAIDTLQILDAFSRKPMKLCNRANSIHSGTTATFVVQVKN